MSNKYLPNSNFASKSHISNMDEYKKMYESSINDPSGFWENAAERISCMNPGMLSVIMILLMEK